MQQRDEQPVDEAGDGGGITWHNEDVVSSEVGMAQQHRLSSQGGYEAGVAGRSLGIASI